MQKTVVLGITGSIAAYKAAEIVSLLRKLGVDVHVIMTEAAQKFVAPLTFETLSANPVVTDLFSRSTPWEVEHIALAKRADAFVVAPASANFLGKAAAGIADDMLTTTLIATKAPVLVAPAMNVNMYESAAVQENIKTLLARGYLFAEPDAGRLACGDTGKGRLVEPASIVERIMSIILPPDQDLAGLNLLVSAGPTRESIDSVRYITNRSTGKMGYALAEAAHARGANVVLISGPVSLKAPDGVKVVDVTSSHEMCEAVKAEFSHCDALIMAAAPADFTPEAPVKGKIKKAGRDSMDLKLVSTDDILATVSVNKGNRYLVGFAAEADSVEANAKEKLLRKGLDMIAANDICEEGAGFSVDTNNVTLYKQSGECLVSGKRSKREIADWILDEMLKIDKEDKEIK